MPPIIRKRNSAIVIKFVAYSFAPMKRQIKEANNVSPPIMRIINKNFSMITVILK